MYLIDNFKIVLLLGLVCTVGMISPADAAMKCFVGADKASAVEKGCETLTPAKDTADACLYTTDGKFDCAILASECGAAKTPTKGKPMCDAGVGCCCTGDDSCNNINDAKILETFCAADKKPTTLTCPTPGTTVAGPVVPANSPTTAAVLKTSSTTTTTTTTTTTRKPGTGEPVPPGTGGTGAPPPPDDTTDGAASLFNGYKEAYIMSLGAAVAYFLAKPMMSVF